MKFKEEFNNSPKGIKIISIIYYFTTLVYIGIAIISFAFKNLLKKIPDFSSINLSLTTASILLGTTFLVLAIFTFFVATGLIKRKNWARIALIVFASINAIGSISSITRGNIFSLINVAFNLIIVTYLMINTKIKNFFD